MTSYIIGIDTGGTFTDITVMTDAGEVFVDKSPTTPHEFSIGVMDALQKMSGTMGIELKDLLSRCTMFKHGSTVATNALITREGSKVGLITTEGLEDTTLIMRAVGRVAGLTEEEIKHQATAIKPQPLVPKQLIKPVTERIDFKGEVLIPINLEETKEALRSLIEDEKVEAVAVNFIWSFVNPVHEQEVRKLAESLYSDRNIFFCYANETCPVIREYARSNTVIINAFLGKTITNYINNLEEKLKKTGYSKPSLIMQANGGVVRRERLTPVGTIGSGPSGGMIASKFMADQLKHRNVITTDMGGTSFDVGLIVDGFWKYMRESIVERFHINWPMLDIQSIGAGGGTIAWIHPVTNRLMMGPKSAAARPGPACYALGGTEPTVTDADLMLNFLDPNYFLGGKMKLDKERAKKALQEKIGRPLKMDAVEAAAAIYQVINGHMSDLIRKRVVTTGNTPDEFVVYAFGGAGPVHAAAFARELGVSMLYVFSTSAAFSSFGVATADVIHTSTLSRRYVMPADPQEINNRINEVEERLMAAMRDEGFRPSEVSFRRTFYMRYRRQLNELDVDVPTIEYKENDLSVIMDMFERKYEEVYGEGSGYREAGIEIISMRIDATGMTPKPALKSFSSGRSIPPKEARKGTRQVYFPGREGTTKTPIYEYGRLKPGNVLEGPAIAETPNTTVVIPSDAVGTVDNLLNMKIVWKEMK